MTNLKAEKSPSVSPDEIRDVQNAIEPDGGYTFTDTGVRVYASPMRRGQIRVKADKGIGSDTIYHDTTSSWSDAARRFAKLLKIHSEKE